MSIFTFVFRMSNKTQYIKTSNVIAKNVNKNLILMKKLNDPAVDKYIYD